METETLTELCERLEALEKAATPGEWAIEAKAEFYGAVVDAAFRLIEAAKIAGELGATRFNAKRTDDEEQYYYECPYCTLQTDDEREINNPANHPPTCLHRRAVEANKARGK